jgi:flagellar biosynthesis/type III secretory pathway M-ring protein FliF/YscJ
VGGQNQPAPGGIVFNETREQGLKKQIKELSSSNPDIVAQLLRTWIKEGEDDNE